MKRIVTIIVFSLLLLPLGATAQMNPARALCEEQIRAALAQQQRVYRTVLFGMRDAEEEQTGNSRFTQDGTAWIKTAVDTWRTAAPLFLQMTLSDRDIDRRTEWPGMNEMQNVTARERRWGIFETKGVLTSELIEPLVQSRRALDCRTASVCEAVKQSRMRPAVNGMLPIRTVFGCEPLQMPDLPACRFLNPPGGAGDTAGVDALSESLVNNSCEPARQDLLTREDAVLRLAVTYDASYRSLLQFAGNFDAFLGAFHDDILTPIADSMSILGQLSRIPCFISQCNG